MGLDNKTPAEVAGLDFRLGENRWLSLIKQSTKFQKVKEIYKRADLDSNI